MSEPSDPTAKLTAVWSKATSAWMESTQAFWTAAATAGAASVADPLRSATAVQGLISDFVSSALAHLPDDLSRRFAAQGAPTAPPRPSGPRPASDPAHLAQLWQAMWSEYEGDLSALPDAAFAVDFAPLSEAFAATTAGAATPKQSGMVRDFLEALAVKARFGAEYYADPAETPVRPTPRSEVHRVGPIELHRYAHDPAVPRRGPPVLIVYSVINRSYILDLSEDCSFVKHLLDQGLDVFMVEWGPTEAGDHERTLDWTLAEGLHGCVQAIEQITGQDQVALFGHCIGGTFAAMYAALHPERVARLLCLTAPFAPAEGGVVAWLTDPANFPLEQVVGTLGHMPAKLIRYTFLGLKPYYELTKWRSFVRNLGEPEAMARFRLVDRWANDNVDVPPEVFRAFVAETLQSERLASGETVIDGRPARLSAITAPILSVYGEGDWIVRPESALAVHAARPGRDDDRTLALPGGHLGLILDDKQHARWPELAAFLAGEAAP